MPNLKAFLQDSHASFTVTDDEIFMENHILTRPVQQAHILSLIFILIQGVLISFTIEYLKASALDIFLGNLLGGNMVTGMLDTSFQFGDFVVGAIVYSIVLLLFWLIFMGGVYFIIGKTVGVNLSFDVLQKYLPVLTAATAFGMVFLAVNSLLSTFVIKISLFNMLCSLLVPFLLNMYLLTRFFAYNVKAFDDEFSVSPVYYSNMLSLIAMGIYGFVKILFAVAWI
ncbi:hypothetical protein [Natranaerobius thermophilus]|uniref:Yip1 domain-containing protein n=1 Tax=Natranaerobius thermophilus (strain ATCC BAA-1301 / DSM 18059 / JW/NM-WN-LF) TaxID=457570 RepID=B2A1V5_NATTJ|nr:hypothetical protein [Natranaerobius thermophilus]ACB86152.1 hypothetical protein Nther_2596 [Natranaerobius thermophilus JW/NM-WN-LF]